MGPARKPTPKEDADMLTGAGAASVRLAAHVVSQVLFPIVACGVLLWVVFFGPNSTTAFAANVKEITRENSAALEKASNVISAAVRDGTTAQSAVTQASTVAQSAVIQAAAISQGEAFKSGLTQLDAAIVERTNSAVKQLQADILKVKEDTQRIREAVTAIQLEVERTKKQ